MTLYTSDERIQKIMRTLIVYFSATIFCFIFSSVYQKYSHGVHSFFMTNLFWFPMLLGFLPFLILRFLPRLSFPKRVSFNIYNAGVATLTVGSCMRGVLDIYGTTSNLIAIYWITGVAMVVLGALMYAPSCRSDVL